MCIRFINHFSHLSSARQNLVIELSPAQKTIQFLRFFSKVTRSFVAIELSTLSKMQSSIFIGQYTFHYPV